MNGRRDKDDFDAANVDQFICKPNRLSVSQLAAFEFPLPCYEVGASSFWTPDALRPWLESYHFAHLMAHPDEADELFQLERLLRPTATDEAHRASAIRRYVAVATARSLVRRVP